MSRWRLLNKPDADTSDLVAIPAAIAEGKIAGKFLGGQTGPNTLIIQKPQNKGVVVGADVFVRKEQAKKEKVGVAKKPRTGRGGTTPLGAIHFNKFIAKESVKVKVALEKKNPEDLATLVYTSGTTGKPKGAMLKMGGFYHHTQVCISAIKVKPADKIVVVLPMFHVYALNALVKPALQTGATIILIPQYDPAKLIETMAKHKATIFCAVPTIIIHLLQVAKKQDIKLPKTLRFTLTAAAPVTKTVLNEFEEIFQTKIFEGFGMTECTAIASINPEEKRKIGSIGVPVGKLFPDVCDLQMKIVNDKGEELPAGERGEILIHSKQYGMLGYYNRPDATAETIKNGWIYSGDIGWKDEEGYFYISDRKKDMLISGGFNVYPREIEEVLSTHPKVMEATVIGIEHETKGEVPKAFVVLNEGEKASPEEIISYCQERLASYKVPAEIEFKEALPKVLSGKVLKKELRKGYVDLREVTKDMTKDQGGD